MNEELKELLTYYDEEKALLDSLIKEDLIDYDYKSAGLHSNALFKIENQIRLLKSLIDPLADEKKSLSRQIEFFSTQADLSGSNEYRIFMLAQIDKKLDNLNKQKPEYFNDGQEFDDVIFDLLEKRIKGFTFHLKKSANLYLDFSIKNSYLRIKLTPFSKLRDYLSIDKSEVINLKQIGFRKNKSKKYLRYKYPSVQFRDSIFIKTIVSRVIYEVFFYHDLDTATTLEIKT